MIKPNFFILQIYISKLETLRPKYMISKCNTGDLFRKKTCSTWYYQMYYWDIVYIVHMLLCTIKVHSKFEFNTLTTDQKWRFTFSYYLHQNLQSWHIRVYNAKKLVFNWAGLKPRRSPNERVRPRLFSCYHGWLMCRPAPICI